jgi:hypothetical protein
MKKLALLLVLAVASTAMAATIQYGVAGSGNYAAPNVSSESYDWYVDYDWDSVFPLPTDNPAGNKAPSGFEGYILLALNPYTGEIWTDIPNEYQAAGGVGGSYTGHASSLTGSPLLNTTPSATGVLEDCIFITGEHRWDGGGGYFGSWVSASADGALLTDGFDGTFPAGLNNYYAKGHSVGATIDTSAGTWVSGPTNSTFLHVGAHNWMWYTGTASGSTTLAFQMDGIPGWMSLSFSGDRTGVTLNEYYFDVPEPATMSLLAIGGVAALIRRKK